MPLDDRTVSLVRISALAARPSFRDELSNAVRAIHEHGSASRDEVHEVFLQLYLFAGFPAALEGMRALARSWPEETIDALERAENAATNARSYRNEGELLYQRVYKDNAPKVRQEMLRLSPELAAWAVVEGYGKTLSRPGLDSITRELCIVATLTQLAWDRQLFSHVLGAKNVGASKEAILEAAALGALGDPELLISAEQLIKKVV